MTARETGGAVSVSGMSISRSCWPRAVPAPLKTVNNTDTAHAYLRNARFFIGDLLSLTPVLLSLIELSTFYCNPGFLCSFSVEHLFMD